MKAMRFSPYFPIYPFKLNQGWGTEAPQIYAQFGFNKHNGLDAAMAPDALVRAPFTGTLVSKDFQPNGGGIYCGLISDDEYDFDAFDCTTPDGTVVHFPAMTCRVLFDFLHLESISANVGKHYAVGDVLAVQDNTGFSTGPHTHIQPRRVSWDGKTIMTLDTNDAHNTFDPTQFWNGDYAKDIWKIRTLTMIVSLLQRVLSLKGRSTVNATSSK